jgi:hypothetical protein
LTNSKIKVKYNNNKLHISKKIIIIFLFSDAKSYIDDKPPKLFNHSNLAKKQQLKLGK